MAVLNASIQNFFRDQGFVLVSTLDKSGSIHNAAKGIVGLEGDKIFLIDLYRARTYTNVLANPTVSVTAVDGHRFQGYTLKGQARIVERDKIQEHIIAAWEERVIKRISQRMVRNIQEKTTAGHHPESKFPHPQYVMEIEVKSVVDLAPSQLK